MTQSMDVAQAKSRLSELLNRAAFGKERFLIRKRGRPVAAIVSADDLARLEGPTVPKRGLLAAVGILADFDDWEESINSVIAMRATAVDREVDLE